MRNGRHPLARNFLAEARADKRADNPLGIETMLSTASKLGPPSLVGCFNRWVQDSCLKVRPDGSTIASKVCGSRCYLWTMGERLHAVQERAEKNELIVARPDFSLLLMGAIRDARISWFRFHDIGDFDTPEYISMCIEVISTLEDVFFWAYTRAWVVDELIEPLTRLASLPNMDLLFSADRSMPEPHGIPGVPVAWFADTDFDEPPGPKHVGFRGTVHRNTQEDSRRREARENSDIALPVFIHRNVTQKKSMNSTPVCPLETGYPVNPSWKDCINCRLCMPKARARLRGR